MTSPSCSQASSIHGDYYALNVKYFEDNIISGWCYVVVDVMAVIAGSVAACGLYTI